MRKYKRYTDEDVLVAVKSSRSLGELLRKLNLRVAGGNYANMKRKLQMLNADCNHWKGQAWSEGERLKDWTEYTAGCRLKSHLIVDRGHRCEDCGRKKWKKQPIPLELHHVDGDRTNNTPANLQLLCCNCHALTETWRKRTRQ